MARDIAQLTGAIAAGDPAAFSTLYRERFDDVHAWAKRATGRDESFCLDITQDVFMRVIKAMKVMESEAQLETWLRRVTLTASYDRLRREKAWKKRHEEWGKRSGGGTPTVEATVGGTGDGAAAGVDHEERLAWLREELARLDEAGAMLLEARHRFGWTLARIGAALGMKAGAVDGRISRLTGSLRQRGEVVGDE